MAGTVNKVTFQRLTLLYLIARFPNGVCSSLRLQQLLYVATLDAEPKPFTFHNSDHGPYSHDAGFQLVQMLESGFVKRGTLNGARGNDLWQVGDDMEHVEIDRMLGEGFPRLARSLNKSVNEFGFLSDCELEELTTKQGHAAAQGVLLAETSADRIGCGLNDVDCEDLELMLSTELFSFVARRTQEIADASMDGFEV